jgi:hypothetical protein
MKYPRRIQQSGGLYINTDPQQRGANLKIGSRAQGIGGQSKTSKIDIRF